MTAHEITGDEKAEWWERAVAAYPPYAEYQEATDRVIPVFVPEPVHVVGAGGRPTAVAEELNKTRNGNFAQAFGERSQ